MFGWVFELHLICLEFYLYFLLDLHSVHNLGKKTRISKNMICLVNQQQWETLLHFKIKKEDE